MNRHDTPDPLLHALQAEPHGFNFFQALRLLRLDRPDASLQVRPRLGLEFPPSDLDAVDPLPDGGWRITANFLGLYGAASPLPTFYTEDLLAEQREGRHAMRGFLDIAHDRLYALLFDAWVKYRFAQRVAEHADPRATARLHALVGLAVPAPHAEPRTHVAALLRAAALLAPRARGATALRALVAAEFADAGTAVDCCTAGRIALAPHQRARLGHDGARLGDDALLGCRIVDRAHHLRVRLSGLSAAALRELLPGGAAHARLAFLVRRFLAAPLLVELRLELAAGAARPARLSRGAWSHLGLDTWLAPVQAGVTLPLDLAAPPKATGAP